MKFIEIRCETRYITKELGMKHFCYIVTNYKFSVTDDPNLLVKIGGAIAVILILGLIITHIYVLAKYGNTPVSEMPTWVWWWLQGGN